MGTDVRYWSFDEWVKTDPLMEGCSNNTVTLSEQEILDSYYPFWYDRLCKNYSKEYVDANFSKEDCIEEWVIIHWAWESTVE